MASAIDATKPIEGNPLTASVRANFAEAASEIEELQRVTKDSVIAGGTADALTANFVKDVVLADGIIICVVAAAANATATPTLNADSTGAKTIVKGTGIALEVGDIPGADYVCLFRYNGTSTEWHLLNPYASTDAATLGGVAIGNIAQTNVAETFTNNVTVEGTLTADDLGSTARPVGYNVAAPAAHDTAYTLVLADAGKAVIHTNSTAYAWTIPPNASVAFPLGTMIQLINYGTGDITVTRGAGVTLQYFDGSGATASTADSVLAGGSVATVYKYSTDTWFIWGNGLT